MKILALEVKMDGKASSNIALYQKSVLDTIAQLKTKELITDEDFSSADQIVKICKVQESNLFTAKQAAQDKSASIKEVFAAIDNAQNIFRDTRLVLEKQIKTEKQNRKLAIINGAVKSYWERHDKITKRYKLDVKISVPAISQGFTDATKGKKNIDLMQEAVDAVLKTEITHLENIASKKFSNLQIIRGRADPLLFPDADALSDMQPDELMVEIEKREAAHKIKVKEQEKKIHEKAEEELAKKTSAPVGVKNATPPQAEPKRLGGDCENNSPRQEQKTNMGFDLAAPGSESESVQSGGFPEPPREEAPGADLGLGNFRIEVSGNWTFQDNMEGAKKKATYFKEKFDGTVKLINIS